jgi:hypothetical protein
VRAWACGAAWLMGMAVSVQFHLRNVRPMLARLDF